MKRLLPRLIVALLTFIIGSAFATWCHTYHARVSSEQKAKRDAAERVVSVPIVPRRNIYEVPKSLAAELEHVDRIYRKRCGMPDEYSSGWPAIESLDRLRGCYDDWAKARRAAIDAEKERHLTTL